MTEQRPTHEQLLVAVAFESMVREIFTQPGEVSDRADLEQRQADLDALPHEVQVAVITLNRDGWQGSWSAMLETARIMGSSDD